MASEMNQVGYKRPPQSTRFKPGQSGNPSGRKKSTPNLKTELMAELNETISFEEDGHRRRYTRQRAIVKRLVDLAIKGDIRAINAIVALSQVFDANENQTTNGDVDTDGEKIMNDYLERERRRSDPAFSKPEKGSQ